MRSRFGREPGDRDAAGARWGDRDHPAKVDPKGFLELVKEKRPNLVYLVPSMLRLILDHPDVARYDLAGVKYLMTGTAPLPHDSVKRALELWPYVRMRNSYGMSEGGIGIGTTSQEQVLKPGCVGKLPAHMQVRDENGNVITLRPGTSATPDEIIAFCREHLADNKVPRTLLVLDKMPLNPNGKILKKELLPLLTGERPRRAGRRPSRQQNPARSRCNR